MRVLCSDEDGDYVALEIMEIGYTDKLEDFDDIEASGIGLYFVDMEDIASGIPGIELHDCNSIVREIYRTGMYDLTRYGNIK